MSVLLTGYAETGIQYAFFLRRRRTDGQFWNNNTSAFEEYNSTNIAAYGLAATETDTTGIYTVEDPAELIEGDFILVKAAASALSTDDLINLRWQDHAGTFSSESSSTGTGSVVVDHNYGGANALAYKTGSNHGIEGATISCYLTTEYDAGHYTSDFVVAATTTDFNGQWRNPMMLDPNDYTLIYFKQGDYGPDRRDITVS